MDPRTPTPEHLATLARDAGPGPVVLTNLVQFREGQADAYWKYTELVTPLAQQARAEVIFAGAPAATVAGDGDWDFVALVRFPSIEVFVSFVGGTTYQTEARALREQGVERTIWMVTKPAELM